MKYMRFTVLGVVLGGLVLMAAGCKKGHGGGDEGNEPACYTLLPEGVASGVFSISSADMNASFNLLQAQGNGRPYWRAEFSGELQLDLTSYHVAGKVERSANSNQNSLVLHIEGADEGACKLEVKEMRLRFTKKDDEAGVRRGHVESVEQAWLWEEEDEKDTEEWRNPIAKVSYKPKPKNLVERMKNATFQLTFQRQGSGE